MAFSTDISIVNTDNLPIFAVDKINDMDWNGMSDTAIVAEVGKRLQEYRTRKKFTQVQIAERTGLSVFTISQMENGKNTSLSSIVAVLRVLKLLENFELLIPKPMISPIELLQKQSKKR